MLMRQISVASSYTHTHTRSRLCMRKQRDAVRSHSSQKVQMGAEPFVVYSLDIVQSGFIFGWLDSRWARRARFVNTAPTDRQRSSSCHLRKYGVVCRL